MQKLKRKLETLYSVQFSCSVVSDYGLQHASAPCTSQTPGVHPNPCPLSLWCHPTISPFVVPFSSFLQSFSSSGSFPMSQFFSSCSQSIGASASVLPMDIQDWFPYFLSIYTSFYGRYYYLYISSMKADMKYESLLEGMLLLLLLLSRFSRVWLSATP